MTIRLPILVFAVLACCTAAWGQLHLVDGLGDPRVKAALDEEDLLYRITEKGQFLLTFAIDGDETGDGDEEGRSHLVIVNSHTSRIDDCEFREVYCVGYLGAPLTKYQMNKLLRENAKFIIGAWEISEISEDDDNRPSQNARFCARIDADCPPATLRAIIPVVAQVGDSLEKDWLGTDEW